MLGLPTGEGFLLKGNSETKTTAPKKSCSLHLPFFPTRLLERLTAAAECRQTSVFLGLEVVIRIHVLAFMYLVVVSTVGSFGISSLVYWVVKQSIPLMAIIESARVFANMLQLLIVLCFVLTLLVLIAMLIKGNLQMPLDFNFLV